MPKIIKPVAKGDFTSATISVDGQGRIVSASSGAGGSKGFTPNFYETGPSSGTFTANTDTNHLMVYATGGGGGHGGTAPEGRSGGHGGDGGYAVYSVPVTAPYSAPYAIGAAGNNGNPGSPGNSGGGGGATNLGSPALFTVNGGSGASGSNPGGFSGINPVSSGNVSNAPSPDGNVNAEFFVDSNSPTFNGPGAGNFNERPVLGSMNGAGSSNNAREPQAGYKRSGRPGAILIFENDT